MRQLHGLNHHPLYFLDENHLSLHPDILSRRELLEHHFVLQVLLGHRVLPDLNLLVKQIVFGVLITSMHEDVVRFIVLDFFPVIYSLSIRTLSIVLNLRRQ